MVNAKDYRPWELHRTLRCAACGRIAELGDNGVCAECETRWSEPIVAAPVRRQSRDTW